MDPLLSNPNVQAWLALIRHAEGTAKYKNPYGTAFTGAQFDNNGVHPAVVRGRAGGWRSDAAGAYQFLSTTWKEINGGRNVPMTQINQDIAAVKLIQRRGVDPTQPLTPQSLAKLAPEWASLPTLAGKSYHGQHARSYNELAGVFAKAAMPGAHAQYGLPRPIATEDPAGGTLNRASGQATDLLNAATQTNRQAQQKFAPTPAGFIQEATHKLFTNTQ